MQSVVTGRFSLKVKARPSGQGGREELIKSFVIPNPGHAEHEREEGPCGLLLHLINSRAFARFAAKQVLPLLLIFLL